MKHRWTYDKQADAAYIYLKEIAAGEARHQAISKGDCFILDFDPTNRLIGIEVLNASVNLHPDALAECDKLEEA